jgi:predicted MPP superfamily phosphohydrolase
VIPRRIILLSPILLAASTFAQTPQDTFEGVKRVVAIGDVHGDLQALTTMLRTAQLINAKNAWIGGAAHLVLTGDYVDRGPDSAKVMDLLIDLEPQAQRAGGRVHALIGNHETLDLYGDLRYVSKEDFKSYENAGSAELRDAQMNVALENLKQNKTPPADERAWRKQYEQEHPLGWVEHRMAFLPSGKYGKWLRQKNTIIKINDALFLHGGISPKYANTSIREINDEVRLELADFTKIEKGSRDGSEPGE